MIRFPLPTLAACVAGFVLAGHVPAAGAQSAPADYPSRPVRIIAPYAPGGTVDSLARAMGAALSSMLDKTFFVENRPGAGGNVGLSALAKAAPDGYTLGLGAANMLATNRALYKSLPFDTIKDFTPVGFIGKVPYVLVVHPSVPARTLPELIAELKAHPDKYSFGSSGQGNTAHIFGELFKVRTGTKMVHVPYKSSGESLQDLLTGRIQLQFFTPVDLLPHIRSGALRPIAIASSRRLPSLPDVPTLGELNISGFETPTWFGLIAPAGTPPAIVDYLHAQIERAKANPEVAQRLERAGVESENLSPEQFAAFIRQEVSHWAKVVKESGTAIE
ncbi:MAG: tripartite tricarboxylate transporter substrate binding protein [Pigmentiphaga sp.]|uniref:Bug family tripartite tricarboxylate transporter substrate binding protein n=1 Tax=Pigmentiphaga sp. TaxID=1977564 RepID=UPI0029AC7171|nr:tripartite tricarboxylate transporter substrate binding protein [Pigmentiphaga sp.]MDX3907640.1 tripartite tricarboxylate transporter substrate binding protein [Pigmentiphaga sp.]